MNVTDFQEVWQIDVGGQIYEANFEVVANWIFEGSLLPQDLVKRGDLRWIEARKVPVLHQFFNAKERGMPPPVFASTTDAQAPPQNQFSQPQNFAPPQDFPHNSINQPPVNNFQPPQNSFDAPPVVQNFASQNNWQQPQPAQTFNQFNEVPPQNINYVPADVCTMHPDVQAIYACETCANSFCRACPKSYGGNVKICPFCGAMCDPIAEIQKKTNEAQQYEHAFSQGFGFEDFINAVKYPFKFKTSLIAGSIMFVFFTLGESAGSFGGMGIMAAAIISWMFANMLTFGILANTVDNFAQGKVGLNFMPTFDDFSMWDDVVHPFFLCIGTYLASFGPFLLIVIFIVWFSWTTFHGRPPVSLEDKINVAQKNIEKRKSGEYTFNEDGTVKTGPGLKADDIQDIEKIVREQRKKEIESVAGKTVEEEQADRQEMVANFMKMGLPAIAFSFLALLWGIFYYPAACLVAGYTRSFTATLNPTIGWETIRILGWDYFKILLTFIIISLLSVAVDQILGSIFYAFNMPSVGNIPAKVFGALFGFYVWIVLSVFLGFALYKNSDKLNLFKG
jgi:hypothetical protein